MEVWILFKTWHHVGWNPVKAALEALREAGDECQMHAPQDIILSDGLALRNWRAGHTFSWSIPESFVREVYCLCTKRF